MIDILPLIEQCAPSVTPTTLMHVITVESSHRPEAIGFLIWKNKKAIKLKDQPRSKEEAITWAKWLLKNDYEFDAGITQIHSTNFARYNLTPENVFDPCINISKGGAILTAFYLQAKAQHGEGQTSLLAAISAYQTGTYTGGFKTGYVQKVVQASSRSKK